MKRYFRMELRRAFRNKRIITAFSLGIGLSIWHYFAYIYPLREFVYIREYPLSTYNKWIGGECYSLQSSLLYMLLPIICALPYGESWIYDCTKSIGEQAMIRGGKTPFILTKFLVSFVNGAIIALLPLLFDFALTSSVLPAIMPKVGLGLSPIGARALLGDLFYDYPFIYTLIYIGINGLFFGLLNTLSFVSRLFTTNRYMVILAPFLYYMAFHCIGTTIHRFDLCPSGFLRPCQQFETTWSILIAEIFLIFAICCFSTFKNIQEEHGLL